MGYPSMTAPPSLLVLPEMVQKFQTEASYAELKDRHDELQHQFKLQKLQDRKAFADQKEAILAQFEKQRAEIAPQLDGPLWSTVEQILSQKKDLEIELLRRTFEERERTLQKRRDDEERQYRQELVTVVTALMSAGQVPSSDHQPALLEPQPCRMGLDSPQGAATSGQATSHAEAAPTDPGGSEIPSPSQAIAPVLAMHATAEAESAFQGSVSGEARPRSPHTVVEHNQNPITEASRHERSGQSSPEAPVPGEPVTTHETSGSQATVSVEDRERLTVAAKPLVRPGPFHKRKATEKPTDGSPASAQGRGKRRRTENNASQADSMALNKSPPARVDSHREADRTILFEALYKPYKSKEENGIMPDGREIDPKTGKPVYRHVIASCHHGSGKFYIVKCDEHGVHFGEHPLRGAGKHLASAQHGFMSKTRSIAIDTLGYQVLGCTKELAERNNADFIKAVGDGYKPLNANNLNQAERAKLGFRPLGPPGSQKAAAQRPENRGASQAVTKPFTGIIDPVECRFYVGCGRGGDVKCLVLVLPRDDVAPAGLRGTLADIGFFGRQPDDGEQSEIPKLPKCYVYKRVGGQIRGIKGWASDYQDGGPLVNKREFPVLCVDKSDYHHWSIGWIKARNLSVLDFDDPASSVNLPFFQEARSYYFEHILCHRGNGKAGPRASSGSEGLGGSTPRQGSAGRFRDSAARVAAEDAVMEEVEAAAQKDDSERDSDRDSVGKSATDSDNDAGRADAESRRTSISNRGESLGGLEPLEGTVGKPTSASTAAAPMSPGSHARSIAAQALGLPTPPLTAFTPINAAPVNATSRAQAGISRSVSASAPSTSLEPPSGTGSVLSTTADNGRVVEMHARSSSSQQTSQGLARLSVSLPERPADAIPPQHGSASQSQGTTTKPILPSLQNILKDASGLLSQPPTPAAAERLAPFPVMGIFTPPPASSRTINTGQPEPAGEGRAVSAPVQQSNPPMEPEKRRAGSASAAAAPGPPWESTRQGPAPEPILPPQGQRQQPPQPIQLPPPFTARPDLVPLNGSTPLGTPTTSVPNTRANSPALMLQPPHGPFSPALGLSKPNTPTALSYSAGTPQPGGGGGCFVPTMDVFDIAGCSQGGKEVFMASSPGEFLRLVDDHQSGVFRTAGDAPASVSIEPARIKLVERSPAQGRAACVVRITYVDGAGVGGGGGGSDDEGTTMLVFEKARSTASGMQNGMVHARRFCRRLQVWNPQILCPAPSAGPQ